MTVDWFSDSFFFFLVCCFFFILNCIVVCSVISPFSEYISIFFFWFSKNYFAFGRVLVFWFAAKNRHFLLFYRSNHSYLKIRWIFSYYSWIICNKKTTVSDLYYSIYNTYPFFSCSSSEQFYVRLEWKDLSKTSIHIIIMI